MSVLSTRYASPEMVAIWSPEERYRRERRLWLAIMKAQAEMGVKITPDDIAAYEFTAEVFDLQEIERNEAITGHDLKARIETWNRLAGRELIHLGLTSCDITETVTAWLVRDSLSLVLDRVVAVLARLGPLTRSYVKTPIVGRTHNIPAQMTTLGRRFAACAQEMMGPYLQLTETAGCFPVRGLQGAVGTSADMLRLLGGDQAKLRHVTNVVRNVTGMQYSWVVVGQTSPRSADLHWSSLLVEIASGPASLAQTIRLMVGNDLAVELPALGQVGSSAMPHKSNPRYAERIAGLMILLRGYQSMLAQLAGFTWNEGDVSDSCVRRVALPDMLMTMDGLLRTFMVALDRFVPDLNNIGFEIDVREQETSTGRLLMEAVRRGVGREVAHRALRECMGSPELIGKDERLPFTADEAERLIQAPPDLGNSHSRTMIIADWISEIVGTHFEAAGYNPGQML